ncbi:MAG: c-type cytochrome, partial [Nitrospinales bacterium]
MASKLFSCFFNIKIFSLILGLLILGTSNPLKVFSATLQTDIPQTISLQGKEIVLKDLSNPFREEPEKLDQYVREGGEIYFKHCFLCHGDLLDGSGVFGDRFFPPPANFKHPESILSKPEYYTFWRIMKGGKGLPEKYNPWDSAMPAWENVLSQNEAWKVVLFLFETVGEFIPENEAPSTGSSVEKGKTIYNKKCAICHGETGKGDGLAAPFTSPRPRKLYKGNLKFRSTPFGKIPTDQDIFNIITKGMPGTTMPSWKHLSEESRWSLVSYLKVLAKKKYDRFARKGKKLVVIEVPEPPEFSLESIEAGKELFLKNCSGCHGMKGRGDGESTHRIVNVASDAIWPRNLSKPWNFRRGSTRKDLYLTIRTGLTGTAMPRFSERTLKDEEVWSIVHYVQTLSPPKKPVIKKSIQVEMIPGDLPLDPEDPVWDSVNAFFIPVGGQIMESEKLYFPTVDSLKVKAVHNGREIAFHITWDDQTFDPNLIKHISVKESPPPPLPPELQLDPSEEEEEEEAEHEPQEFPDAMALQFP